MELNTKETLNDETIRETFRALKPLCVQILDQKFETPEDCTLLSIKIDRLADALPSLPERGLKACADYLLFPLATLTKFITMKPPTNSSDAQTSPSSIIGIDRVLESLLSCLSIVFSLAGPWSNRTLIDILQLFLRILDIESSLVIKKTTSLMDAHRFLSEDGKMSLLECFAQLFKNYVNKSRDNKGLTKILPSDESANVLRADEMLPTLGYAAFKVLEFASKEKNRDLQLKALETMRDMELAINDIDITASFLPGIVGAMATIINGDFKQGQKVFVAAIEVLQQSVCFTLNDKDNATLIEENTPQNPRDFLSQLFYKQSNDKPKEDEISASVKTGGEKPEENSSEAGQRKVNKVQRNSEWYNKAIPNIGKILSKIFSISNQPVNPNGMRSQSSVALLWRPIAYDNWQVRKSLVLCATQIAKSCSKTLQQTLPALIEVVILHLEDDYPQVSSTSRESLYVFFSMISNEGDAKKSFSELLSQATANSKLRELLEENFNKVINSLPRLIRDPDDVNKLLTLRLASGYIQLLQKHLKFILGANLSRLSVALFEILEFDIFDVRIVEQRTMTNMLEHVANPQLTFESNDKQLAKTASDTTTEITSARFRLINAQRNNFKHFRSEDVTRQIIRLCRLLGRYGDPMALADHFVTLAKTHVSSKARKQSVFILNQLALGSAGLGLENIDNTSINPQDAKDLVAFILDEYLSKELWNSNEFEVSESSQNPMAKENDYIILSSLLLEGIGYFAKLTGRAFDDQLRKCLYPILEKLGESSDIISQSAFATLEIIAETCGYASVKELLQKNIDYVVNAISNQLRYAEMNVSSLKVLFGILNFSGQEIVLMLDDILDDLFKGLVGKAVEFRKPLLKILHGIVDIICKEMRNYTKVEKTKQFNLKSFVVEKMKERKEYLAEREKTTQNFEQIREFFTDYHKQKQDEETSREDQLEEINDGMNKDDDEESLQLVRAGQNVSLDSEKMLIKRQFQFVTNILLIASNYLAAKSPETRMLVLDIMERGVKALAYDSSNLLPTVHKLWEPMKPRFVDEDPRVLSKAMNVMEVFSQISQDFLTRKFSEDLWPFIKRKIQQFDLSTYAGKKHIATLNEASQYTNTHSLNNTLQYSTPIKMQNSMLTCLTAAAKFVKVFDKDLHDITNTCRFLLSQATPKELRVKAIELYVHLRGRDENYVWWTLSKLAKKNLHEPPKNSCGLETINLTYLEGESLDPLQLQVPVGMTENLYERSYDDIFNHILHAMGVKGLTSYLQRCGAYVVVDLREQNLSRRQNNANDKITIVVDGMSVCHYIKKKEISLFHPMSFKTFAENARSFLRPFVQQEVQLIVVFDGVFEPIKNSTRTQRRADRWDLIKETLKQVSSNNVPRDPDSTSTMIYRLLLIQILNELNIQHITVPGEADQFIAKYCKTNNHFAVMANDSDYFIMGVDFIMLNTVSFPTAEQDRGITCQLYTKQKVIQALNVGEDKLALFAGLMDNDYVEEKHLNNFYSYLKILKKNSFDTIKKVIQYVQSSYDEEELFKYLGKTPYDNFLRAVSKFRLECEESEKIDVSAIGKCPKEIENRFSSGEFMVALLGILLQKENWLSLVPMMKSDVDIWRIVLPLRKKMYGMMFGSDEIVLERSSGHKPKKVKSNVSLMSGTAQVSHFSEYFNPSMSRQVKLEALLNVTTTGTVDILALHEEIPPQLFLSVVSLRYLLEVQVHWTHVHDEAKHTSTENNTNTLNNSDSSSSMSTSREDIKASEFIKAFTEREFDVLLRHLITMSRVHEVNNNNVDQKHVTLPTARGLHICGVFYLCFQQMLLFNALLNCPFDFNQIKFENLFEGNQFHRALRNSKFMDERPVNDEELQLHNKLKTVILSNLTKDAVFKASDDPDTQPQLTMPTKITLIGPPSLMTDLLNKEIKRLPELQIIKHTTRQIVLQTTNELTAKHIVQFDGTVLNGLALSVELQHKSQNQK